MSAEDAPADPTDPTAAYAYAIEQVWETCRGMWAAYQIETGNSLTRTVAPWSELTAGQRLRWSLILGPSLGEFAKAAVRIGWASTDA